MELSTDRFLQMLYSRRFFQMVLFFSVMIVSFGASGSIGDITPTPIISTSPNSSYEYTLSCVHSLVFNTQASAPYGCTNIGLVTAPAGMTITSTGNSWQQTLKVKLKCVTTNNIRLYQLLSKTGLRI